MVFPVVMYGCESWTIKKAENEEAAFEERTEIILNCGAREGSWESLGLQGDQTSQSKRKSALNIHWKEWCWCRSSNTLVTWCKQPTHWKRLWCWETLREKGEEGCRGWDGEITLLTHWTWVWTNPRQWWTGKPGLLQSSGSQRVRHHLVTEQQQEQHTYFDTATMAVIFLDS